MTTFFHFRRGGLLGICARGWELLTSLTREKEKQKQEKKKRKMTPVSVLRLLSYLAFLGLVLPIMWVIGLLNVLLKALGLPRAWLSLGAVAKGFSRGILALAGVETQVIGRERVKGDLTILMGNHSSGLDPFLLAGTSPLSPYFIYKRSLVFLFPPVFLLGLIYGHIPISRSKRDSAIQSLQKAAKKAKQFKRSIGIFPEGTRTKTGTLLPLKSGAFYMAEEAGLPISPFYIHGAFSLMQKGALVPSGQGVVVVEYLPQIESKGKTHDQLKELVGAALQDAETRWKDKPLPRSGVSLLWCVATIALFTLEIAYFRGYI